MRKSGSDCAAWDSELTLLAAVAVALLVLGYASSCAADCRVGLESRMVDLTHEGADGFFVEDRDVECLTMQLEMIPAWRGLVSDYRRFNGRQEARYADQQSAVQLGTRAIVDLSSANDALAASNLDLRTELDAWYRSITFWLATTGVAVVVGVVVGALL